MLRKLLLSGMAIALGGMLSGCFTSPGGVAPSTIPITARDSYTIVKNDVAGTDWSFSLLGIPLWPCSAYTALQNAKEDNSADALINVTGENQSYFFLVVSWQKMQVRGDAIKFERGGSSVE